MRYEPLELYSKRQHLNDDKPSFRSFKSGCIQGNRDPQPHTGRHVTTSKTTTAITGTQLWQGLETHLRLDPLVCSFIPIT